MGRSIWQRDAGVRRAIRFEDAAGEPRTITDDRWDSLRQRQVTSLDWPAPVPHDSRDALVTRGEFFAQWEKEPLFNELEQTLDDLLSAEQFEMGR